MTSELKGRMGQLRVADAMHLGVVTCPLDAPLPAVARMMATKHIHCVVVQSGDARGGRLWGIVSDRDLLEAIADGDADEATAGGTVRSPVVTVPPEETLIEAARLMASTGMTHLVVADTANDPPLGVISTLDLAGALAGESPGQQAAARVEQLMTTEVATVSPDLPLKEVAVLLTERRISGVPVVSDGKVLGVVSEGDILRKERGVVPHPDGLLGWIFGDDDERLAKLAARTAGEAMTAPAVTIEPWRTPASAAALMIERDVKRLLVVRDDELVGIVTRADLVRAFARSDAAIERDIREEVLRRSFWISPDALDVDVRGGEVKLSGELESETALQSLPHAVERVAGVVSVRSQLRLKESAS